MKKLFFFRSSAPSSGNGNHVVPPPSSDDERVYWEAPSGSGVYDTFNDKVENSSRIPKGLFSKSKKTTLESRNLAPNSGLRKSRSLSSSAAFHSDILGERDMFTSCDWNKSPSSSNIHVQHNSTYPVRGPSLTSEKQSKARKVEVSGTQKEYGEKLDSPCSSKNRHDSPWNCLAHVSDKILDLYIDGEQQDDRKKPRPKFKSLKNPSGNENHGSWRPPRVQSSAPASPTGSMKEKPRSTSFREVREAYFHPSRMAKDIEPESPKKLAKNVVERLSHVFPQKAKTKSRTFESDHPTTEEDNSEEYLEPRCFSCSDAVTHRSLLSVGPYKNMHGYGGEETSYFQKQSHFLEDVPGGMHGFQMEDTDQELHRKAKEAEERVVLLSEALEDENMFQNGGFTASELIQTIRSLREERRNLALDVSAHLQRRIAERAAAKEALRVARLELDSRTRRIEKEKNELQSGLEKELDRRSSDWSFKLGKYQSEEERLRERVRELAEQNVSLQREVSSHNGREMESKNRTTHVELQLKDLTERLQTEREENQDLQQTLSELQEQFRGAEQGRDCFQRSYKEKGKENNELQKTVVRLQRTCSEQEKTISGLRQGLSEEIERKESSEKYDKQVGKLQMEQVRLTGVEQNLRREVESYRLEVDSLRHENINLLGRLQDSGNEGGLSSFKLDQELQARVNCLQDQGLSLFDESSRLCAKLLEFIKQNNSTSFKMSPDAEHVPGASKNGLDKYFLVESDIKVQNFRRRIENLMRSLQTISSVVDEKAKLPAESQPQCTDCSISRNSNSQTIEDDIGSKLKAEALVTTVLREKLLSKQLEIEELQAELATAIRGHDILRCEVQGALDALSCVSYKMKDLELQVLRKDESINQLKNELQECKKELMITKSILPKVSEERDLMWEEVKQYSENNMLLNSQVNELKKKIEVLEEDILLKEGQITILKDSLRNNTSDLLYSPKSMQEFRLD